ncbi:MAG: response regulator [Archangiaceae bacterium]|nr:response regulator [Archangiaceae bacterium]
MTPAPASRVLIIEDEAMLRSSMARSLSRVTNVDVLTASTLGEGLAVIDMTPPALILSDIDLPDRSGLELIGELGRRHLRIPIVYISAYLTAYRAQIPRHANVEVLEKPVGIEELREVVRRHLAANSSPSGITPFGVADYLQLAGMGRHSVVIDVRGRGNIVVKEGVLWSARDEQGEGEEAFYRLALLHTDVTCQALQEDPGPRTMKGGAEELLLEAARRSDEAAESKGTPPTADPFAGFTELELEEGAATPSVAAAPPAPKQPVTPVPAPSPSPHEARPTPIPGHEEFDSLWDQGVEALLHRQYDEALLAFDRCNQLRPDDRRVLANLSRLQTLLKERQGA